MQVIDGMFNVFAANEIRDQSIEGVDMVQHYGPQGKDVSKLKSSVYKIQTKGDTHQDVSNSYIEVSVKPTYAPIVYGFYIVRGVNNILYVKTGANPGDVAQVDLLANANDQYDYLANAAAFQARLQARIGANGANYTFALTGGGFARFTVAAGNHGIMLSTGLANYLGYSAADAFGVDTLPVSNADFVRDGGPGLAASPKTATGYRVDNDPASVEFNASNAQILRPFMNQMATSIFRKASMFINNIQVHSIDYPFVHQFIVQCHKYSDDYMRKHKEFNLYMDKNKIIDNTTRNTDPDFEARFNKTAINYTFAIKLRDMFPFLETMDKTMRGLVFSFEFEKNNNFREVYKSCLGSGSTAAFNAVASVPTGFEITELSLWVPTIKPSANASASMLEDISKNKEGIDVHFEQPQVYRSLQPSSTNINWLIDSVKSVPKRVYLVMQPQSRLEGLNTAASPSSNPGVYDANDLRGAELRIGPLNIFPKVPHEIFFGAATLTYAKNWQRLYDDFVSARTGAGKEYDNGGLISYDEYGTNYPIICFNLEREQILSDENIVNDVEVRLFFGTAPAEDLYLSSVIIFDDHVRLGSDGVSRLTLKK